MSGSWGHAIQPIGGTTTTKAFASTYTKAEQRPHWNDWSKRETAPPDGLHWVPNCSGRACNEKPVFSTRYLYVTGRAGRVTDRVQYWCQAHGEKFAGKHGLTCTPVTDKS